jgi:phospholipid/cholesterol/gamma-HCH transport system substrate-binding protein
VKRDHINYFAVGLFVLLMLGMLLYALLRINGENQKSDIYYTYYRSVSGIKTGAPVAYQGFELGHVDAIEPTQKEGRTVYRLALKLRQGWKIPSDSRAVISASGLLSGMLVEIREGSSSSLLGPGGEIAGTESVNLFESMAVLTEQLSQLTRDDAKPLLANLNRRIERIGGSLEQGVPESMNQLQAVLKKLNNTATLLETTLGGENRAHVTAVLKNTDQSSLNILRLTADFERTRKQLDQFLADTHGVVTQNRPDIEASVSELRDSLQRVNTILHHLEGASLNTNELTRQLRQNPALIIQSKPAADQSEGNR